MDENQERTRNIEAEIIGMVGELRDFNRDLGRIASEVEQLGKDAQSARVPRVSYALRDAHARLLDGLQEIHASINALIALPAIARMATGEGSTDE